MIAYMGSVSMGAGSLDVLQERSKPAQFCTDVALRAWGLDPQPELTSAEDVRTYNLKNKIVNSLAAVMAKQYTPADNPEKYRNFIHYSKHEIPLALAYCREELDPVPDIIREIHFKPDWNKYIRIRNADGSLYQSEHTITTGLYGSAFQFCEYLWDAMPIDIQDIAYGDGWAQAIRGSSQIVYDSKRDWELYGDPWGYIHVNSYIGELSSVISSLSGALFAEPGEILDGSPSMRYADVDKAIVRLMESPTARSSLVDYAEIRPEYAHEESDRMKEHAEQWGDVVHVPEPFVQYIPKPEPKPEPAPDPLEKAMEYLPFVGVGIGAYRAFFK